MTSGVRKLGALPDLGGAGRLGLLERAAVDDVQRPGLGMGGEGDAKRLQPRLAVDLAGVAARMRAEDHAAAGPVRRAGGAGAGAAGALLAPRLRAPARDQAACLRRRGALPARGQLGLDDLVHERVISFLSEQASTSFTFTPPVISGCSWLRPLSVTPNFDDSRPLRRGQRPRRAADCFSVSISTTRRPRWVTRCEPIWPAILVPLYTCEGVADAPIEPGARARCATRARPARARSGAA